MRKFIVILLMLFTLTSCVSNLDKVDALISLSEMKLMLFENGYTISNFENRILGYSKEDIIKSWGNPDGELSGFWGDFWYLDNSNNQYITLYYDSNNQVENISINTSIK